MFCLETDTASTHAPAFYESKNKHPDLESPDGRRVETVKPEFYHLKNYPDKMIWSPFE